MKVELTKKDWENCRKTEEVLVKQCLIDLVVHENMLKTAEEEILKTPPEKAAGVG